MNFVHRDGADAAAGSVSLGPVRDNAKLDADGIFEVDEDREDFAAVRERLEAAGHKPVDETPDSDDDQEDAGEYKEIDAGVPRASDFSETELVEMDREELRPIASQYDDINGNASGEKLTEELIAQRREEVDE